MASTDNNSEVQEIIIPRNILLTSRAEKYMRKGLKLGERMCCHPYVWDDAKDYPEYTTSRLQILGWIFFVIFSTAYFVFLVVQSVRVNASPEEPASNKAITVFASILFSGPVLCHATMMWAREDLSNYVRSSISYLHKFEEHYVRETARPSTTAKIGGIFMTFMYYGLAVDSILFTLYGLMQLDSPEQVSSLISGNPIVQIPVLILFCAYYYTCYSASAFIVAFTNLGILLSFLDVIKELGKDSSDFCTEAFRHPQDRVRAYRVLQLQTGAMDRVYWIVSAASQNMFMFIVMFGVYGAIRLDGIVAIALGFLGVTGAVLLVVLLGSWGEVESGSSTAMGTIHTMTTRADVLENRKMRTWLKKSARSLRAARVPICGMYYIDKPLLLTVFSGISDGIFLREERIRLG